MSLRATSVTIFVILLLPLLAVDLLRLAGTDVAYAAPVSQSEPTVEPCGPEDNIPCAPTPTPDSTPEADNQPGASATVDPWLLPANLSQSGAASTAQSVIDQSGAMHVIWQETDSELFRYVQGTGLEWTSPLTVEVPFGTDAYYPDLSEDDPIPKFSPQLAPGANGLIHAFWIDESGLLQFSSVNAENFGTFSAWEERRSLSEGVLALDVIADSSGQVHLAYIRSLQIPGSPSGVYYRRLTAGEEWSEPTLLYPSLYLRSITVDQANVQLTTSNGGSNVFVVWDNPLLEKVFQARSADFGQSWAAAVEVDGREVDDDVSVAGPSRVSVGASGNNVLLVWQAGHGGTLCGQYYRASSDGGNSWGPRTILDNTTGCADHKQLLANESTPIFLLITNPDETYLLAWNGEEWSEALLQEPLVQFINPETNQVVEFGCHQAHLVGAEQLLVFGCNEGGVADIWFTSRPVGSVEEWFPPAPAWSDPTLAVNSAGEMQALDLVTDADGRLHLFWSEQQDSPIYYSFWNGAWSQSLPALTSPDGMASKPSITFSPRGRLLAVWSDIVSGDVYFSESDPSEAAISGSWSSPIALAEHPSPAVSPEVVATPDGTIYVTYAIPFNEGRGIYLTHSVDAGQTWSTPSLVYDGRADNHTSVGEPRLIVTDSSTLHLLWQLDSLLPGGGLSTVHYTRSLDGGENWTPAETVIEAPVTWSAIVSGAGGRMYRIWQQRDSGRLTLQFQSSIDNGESWSHAGILTSATEHVAPAAVSVDMNGNVHLLQITDRALQHWIAGDGDWVVAEELNMEGNSLSASSSLAVAIDASDRLFAAYIVLVRDDETTSLQNGIQVTDRLVENAIGSAAPFEIGTATPVATMNSTETSTPPPTATPSPTPTLAFPTDLETEGNVSLPFLNSSNRWVRLAVAILPAVLIVLFVLVLRTSILHRR